MMNKEELMKELLDRYEQKNQYKTNAHYLSLIITLRS